MKTIGEPIFSTEKFDVSTVWLRKRRRRNRSSNFKILLKYTRLYCEYSSLVGCRYLVESGRNWLERIVWIVIHATSLVFLIFIVLEVYKQYKTTPVLTVLETDHYPATLLHFPAVAICTINRISQQSAHEIANEVFNTNVSKLSLDEITGLFHEFGAMYDTDFNTNAERIKILQEMFTKAYGQFDVAQMMKRLTPKCSDILIKCKFSGRTRDCSKLFSFRKTQDGFCCTFNYAREQDDLPVLPKKLDPIKPYRIRRLGIESGLTVVLEPLLDDYFFPIFPTEGWKITIFSPMDYPDTMSGGVSEALIGPLTETFLELDAVSFYSTTDIEMYPIKKRQCIFAREDKVFYAGYTYSDCIVQCKVEAIYNICGCRPFIYPRRGIQYSLKVCNIEDTICLVKNRGKWQSFAPNTAAKLQDFFEKSDNQSSALNCQDCYPSCEDVLFIIHTSSSYISPGFFKSELLYDMNITNQSILHIFFSKYGTLRLKQDVALRWYEVLSSIGGICGVFIGFSLISAVEMIYFSVLLLIKLFQQYKRSRVFIKDEPRRIDQPIRTLYWNELLPPVRTYNVHRHHNATAARI